MENVEFVLKYTDFNFLMLEMVYFRTMVPEIWRLSHNENIQIVIEE